MRISAKEFVAHTKPVVDAGFALDPEPFAALAGWNHILLQLHMASYYIARLRAHEPKLGDLEDVYEQNAFFVAFLTNCGKCFVSAERRSVKLDPNDVFKANPSAEAEHNHIIELRHRYAAHNASSGLVRPTMAVKEEVDHFAIRHLITSAIPVNEFECFAKVVELVSDYVTVRLNQRLDKLQVKVGKVIVPD